MEIAYLMVGKRFQVLDKKDETINQALASANLMQDHPYNTVRSISGKEDEWPYYIMHSYGDWADFRNGYDFCVGKIVGDTGERGKEVVETEHAELEKILQEVRKDIPDAKILVFSHWS